MVRDDKKSDNAQYKPESDSDKIKTIEETESVMNEGDKMQESKDISENKQVGGSNKTQSGIDIARYPAILEELMEKGRTETKEAEEAADILIRKALSNFDPTRLYSLEEGDESSLKTEINVDTSNKTLTPELVIRVMERLVVEAFSKKSFSVKVERIGETSKARLTVTYEKKS